MASAAPSSAATTKAKSGRLMSMMSKLRRGVSSEKMGNSRRLDASNSDGAISRTTSGSSAAGSGGPSSLPRHRSTHNLAASARTPPTSWTPPVPPPPPSAPKPEPLRVITPRSASDSLPSPAASPPSTGVLKQQAEPGSLPSPVSMQFKANGTVASTISAPPRRKDSLNRKAVPDLVIAPYARPPGLPSQGPAKVENLPPPPRTPPPRSPLRESHSGNDTSTTETPSQLEAVAKRPTPPVPEPQTPTSPTTPSRSLNANNLAPVDELSPEAVPDERDTTERSLPDTTQDTSPIPTTPTVDHANADTWTTRAAELRHALNSAQHLDESRLLVDMFFTRWGIPIEASNHIPAGDKTLSSPAPSSQSSAEFSVVEMLLGDGEIPENRSNPLPVHSTPIPTLSHHNILSH